MSLHIDFYGIVTAKAFDRHRRKVTAWCEDCNHVFDEIGTANDHQAQKDHKIRVTEFWVTGRL